MQKLDNNGNPIHSSFSSNDPDAYILSIQKLQQSRQNSSRAPREPSPDYYAPDDYYDYPGAQIPSRPLPKPVATQMMDAYRTPVYQAPRHPPNYTPESYRHESEYDSNVIESTIRSSRPWSEYNEYSNPSGRSQHELQSQYGYPLHPSYHPVHPGMRSVPPPAPEPYGLSEYDQYEDYYPTYQSYPTEESYPIRDDYHSSNRYGPPSGTPVAPGNTIRIIPPQEVSSGGENKNLSRGRVSNMLPQAVVTNNAPTYTAPQQRHQERNSPTSQYR
jgi:hypothetical protein